MGELVWLYLTSLVDLIIPLITIKVTFDFIRIFLFGN